jgi:acetylornithine deacetylase/succinyl-diaminopimelate desuccinylase-like protein
MRTYCVIAALAVILDAAAAHAQFGAPDVDQRIAKVVASISATRMEQLLRTLAAFGTRNTLSDTTSPTRGIGAARQWILDEMTRSSPRLQVSFDTHQIPKNGRITRDVELRNIVAILPGRTARRIYVSGHYDTVNIGGQGQIGANTGDAIAAQREDNADAPGANDDGSGTVLVMELARVFAESGIRFDATLVFTAVAGEEQGLIGARAHGAPHEGREHSGSGRLQQRYRRRFDGRRRYR